MGGHPQGPCPMRHPYEADLLALPEIPELQNIRNKSLF